MADDDCPPSGRPASTILLVDDEVEIIPEYQDLLEMEGFVTLATSEPAHAITLVQQRQDIAVVVTDLKMAGLNGADMIRTMRQVTTGSRRLSFIILTGDASSSPDLTALDVPILLKPVDLPALIEAIGGAMTARPACPG